MTMTRINLTVPTWSNARLLLEARKPKLDAAIEAAREIARQVAAGYTKQQIVSSLRADFASDAAISESKDTLVAYFARKTAENTPEHAELEKLNEQAWMDDYTARRINDALDKAEKLHARMIERLTAADAPGTIGYTVREGADDLMTAQHLAGYCASVVAEIGAGADLREAVRTVARDAVRTVMGLPSHLLANGLGSAYRLESLTKAVAAADFAENVARTVLGDEGRLIRR